MSRHRKVKALDYDEEYDDYYGAFDEDEDDDDIDENAFEAKYLSSGIDLNNSNSTSINNSKQRQKLINEVRLNSSSGPECPLSTDIKLQQSSVTITNTSQSSTSTISTEMKFARIDQNGSIDCDSQLNDVSLVTSDLAKFAIEHLDKHQWRLPLLDMDKKFRDKTYYKHYSDTYISSLRSKLGHFLADTQLITNPMKYHLQRELDNYMRYSRMFDLLTEYYHSLGGGFFSFATPSPDEEIIIGCRLGKKVKKPVAKQVPTNTQDEARVARFEYPGSKNANKQQKQQQQSAKATTSNNKATNQSGPNNETNLTVQEDYTSEQLEKLSNQYKEFLKLESKNKAAKKATIGPYRSELSTKSAKSPMTTSDKTKKSEFPGDSTKKAPTTSAPKALETMVEKRKNLQKKLKRSAEPSVQDLEIFKKQALQTTKEYNEFMSAVKNRPTVNLVVVGHVDAGKSTIVGHLLYKLGQVTNKQMHRNEVDSQRSGKASFKYAWALDETEEERSRGVTIDIALTKFETPSKDIVLLDAPGHVDFIPAVISGAAQADAAILVVDATRGEFEMALDAGGQTREHTFLVRSLGVKSLVVAVNKMDNVDWKYDRFRDIVEQLKPFLKQVGFDPDKDVQFVVCSGLTGENLTERRVDKIRKQSSHPQLESDIQNYKSMPSLLEAIDKMAPPTRMVDKPTRVCVTDVFKGMSSGVFLGAKVVSGKVEAKQKLILLPPNESCEIKQIEGRSGKDMRAFAGDIITVVATGVDMEKYYRGCILSDPLIPCNVTNRFVARIIMFQNAGTVLIKGTPIEVHINGNYESGEVRRLLSLLNKNTGELIQSRPRCIAQNSSAVIQLRLSRVVCCEPYESNKDLGRFMLRSCGRTIAAGLITKIKSAKLHKKSSKMRSK